jgi:Tfp pilus assembly protein PilF
MLPGWPATTFGIAVAVVGGFLVSASFCFPLHRAGPPLVLAGFLAVIAASGPEKAVVVKKGRSLWAWGGAGAALMAAIMVAHLFWAWHFLQAERWYRLMVDADNQKRWKLVVGCGGEVLKHDPGRRRTLLYVGRALVASKHPTEAIAVFEEFLQAYPHHLNAWYNLGLAYSEAGDDINAIRAYREVLALNPDIALAHNNLGCIYLRRNELDEAEACFRAGVASEPRNALVWNNFGLTAVRRKDYAKAGHRFRRALTVNERYEAAHYKNLGVLYVQHLYPDRPQEGMSYLRRALQLDPNLPEAEEIRAMLRELEEKSAKKP